MRAQRAADLGIRNLELIFAPLGLPFVQKTDGDAGSTSILVRGAAGSGKTTVAVAIGQAAARHLRGSVLYLTTAIGPAEVSFKASLLGIGEAAIRPWAERAEAPAGSIFVHSLPTLVSAQGRPSGAERGRSAIRAARDLLAESATQAPQAPPIEASPGEPKSTPSPAVAAVTSAPSPSEPASSRAPTTPVGPAPIRVVVIDALERATSAEDDGQRSSDFSSFVQALEAQGVSVVLVLEARDDEADDLSVAVDVVFSTSLREDPETHELTRKLACLKSRFARALPGPHDYGLDPETQRPILWPDLLAVVSTDREGPFAVPKARQARMLVPIASDGEHLVLVGGSIAINPSDRAGTTFVDALRFTPGVRIVEWRCGPLTSVLTKQKRVEIFAGAGPNALGDGVVRALRDASANTVVVHGMETLLEQPRFKAPLLRVLESLRALGVLTCIHGKARALRPMEPLADVIVDDSRRGARKMLAAPRYRPAAHWLLDLTRPDLFAWKRGDLSAQSSDEAKGVAWVQGVLTRAAEATRSGDAGAALSALREIPRDPGRFPGWSGALAAACFVATLARYRAGGAGLDPLEGYASPLAGQGGSASGSQGSAGGPVAAPSFGRASLASIIEEMPSELRAPLGWTYALIGQDGESARACYEACDGEVPGAPALLSLWWSLNAVHAQSNAAIEALAILRGKPEGRFTLGFYLRALARRGRLDDADALAEASREAYNLKDYLVTRLQADARLEAGEPSLLADAKARLAPLASSDALPALHRAEIAHNLGYAHERLGEIDDGVRWYRRALSVNPHLELASAALSKLGETDVRPEARESTQGSAQGELAFQPRT